MSAEESASSIATDLASQDNDTRPAISRDPWGAWHDSSLASLPPHRSPPGGSEESHQLETFAAERVMYIRITSKPPRSVVDIGKYETERDDEEQDEGELTIQEKIQKQEEEGLERAHALEETVLGRRIEPKYTYAELRKTYKRVCEAVAEFELSASTLRTNSTALNLCKELVTRSAPAVFEALKKFRPPPFPEVPVSFKTLMDEWSRGKEMEWKCAESEALTSSSEWIHRSVLRRERLRELVPQWKQEQIQALEETSQLGYELSHLVEEMSGWDDEKQRRVAKVRARWTFERSWQERKKHALDDKKPDIGLLDSTFYASAWYEIWATRHDGPPRKVDSRWLAQDPEVGHWGREALQKWARKLKRLEIATLHARKLSGPLNKRLGDGPLFELRRRMEEESQTGQSALEVETALEFAVTQAGVRSRWETSSGFLEELELSDPSDLRRWWDGGWLERTDDLHKWMEDQWQASENSDEWNDGIDLESWKEANRSWWYGAKARMFDIEELQKICENILKELEKIDGSASAREFNIFNESEFEYDVDRHHLLSDYIVGAKLAMGLGNERRFVRDFNATLDLMAGTLRSEAVKQGLATLIKKQDHFRNSFMDFATVAIFFSSITATTLQFSYQSADQSISSVIVNLCWFASLVLSIASATNSLLGVLVHQSPEYLRPSQNADYYFLQNWFKYTPPTLLTVSGVLFLVGFSSFTYLSFSPQVPFTGQGRAIQAVTTTLTSTNFFALLIIFLSAFWTSFRQEILLRAIRFSTRFATLLVRPATLLIRFTYCLAMLSLLQLLGLLGLPFMTIYGLVRYKRFPPDYWDILFSRRDFGKTGSEILKTYWRCWYGLRGIFRSCRDELEKWKSTSTFCGYWRKLKISIEKHIQFIVTRPVPLDTSLPLESVVTES